jgi:hypothetical protein
MAPVLTPHKGDNLLMAPRPAVVSPSVLPRLPSLAMRHRCNARRLQLLVLGKYFVFSKFLSPLPSLSLLGSRLRYVVL